MEIETELNTSFRSIQHKALVNIRFTSSWLRQNQQRVMDKYEITMPQFNILRILRGAKSSLNVNTLKERMIEKSPNLTRLMDKLLEKNLIHRIRCDNDKRSLLIEISDHGQDLLLKIDLEISETSFFEINISDDEAKLLNNLLDKIRLE